MTDVEFHDGRKVDPMTELSEAERSLAAVQMLAGYRSKDGRRFHPDDTISFIQNLINARHPELLPWKVLSVD